MRTKSQLNKQAKHTTFYKFEEGISCAEHWKLVAESSEFHLMLKRAHRVHFFQLEIRQKSGNILSEKRESGMALKKQEFTPESGTVDTYAVLCCFLCKLELSTFICYQNGISILNPRAFHFSDEVPRKCLFSL